MNKTVKIHIEKIIIIWVVLFYSSMNSFWGYRAFHDSDIFAGLACLIPIMLVLLLLILKKTRIRAFPLLLAVSVFGVVAVSSKFGLKYVLYYGYCVSLLFLSNISDHKAMLKLFYYMAIVFAIGSLINLFLPSVYETVVLPNFMGSNQYTRLARWIAERDRYKIIPGFTNQSAFNAAHFVYGIGYLANKLFVKKSLKWQEWVFFALFLLCLVLTNKRAHFLFMLFALVLCFYYSASRKNRGNRMLIIMFGGPFFLLVLYYLIKNVDTNVFKKLNIMLSNLANDKDITSGRTVLYFWALDYFRRNPLTGIGWEKYRAIPEVAGSKNTHDIYLELLCETGVIGAAIFFVFFGYCLSKAVKNCKYAPDPDFRLAANFCLYMQVFFLLYGVTGNPLYDPLFYIPYFLICAFTLSLDMQRQNSQREPRNKIEEK